MAKWENEKEKLDQLINKENRSYSYIGTLYNCSGSNIKKVARKLGIKLPVRRKVNSNETFNKGTAETNKCLYCGRDFIVYKSCNKNFCTKECLKQYKKEEKIKEWESGKYDGTTAYNVSRFIRNLLIEEANYKCQACGWGEKNPYTGKIPLQIHHKDGDSMNNKRENLEVLCPNCHSLTENYGSRNKNAPKERVNITQLNKRHIAQLNRAILS